jgi:hypothetical protein
MIETNLLNNNPSANLPNGSLGNVLIHNGTNWQAEDIIITRNINWFQANANTVLKKNTIVFLEEDKNCYKISDGTTTLKNLKWYIDRNYGDYSVSGYNGVFGKDIITGKDITHSVFGNSYTISSTINDFSHNNVVEGSFGFLSEPMTIERLGIFIEYVDNNGGPVQVEIGIYQPNFTTKQATLISKTNPFLINFGKNYSSLPSPITLPSGIYIFAVRYMIPLGSYFRYRCIDQYNQIGFIDSFSNINFSYIYDSSMSSLPTTLPFPNAGNQITLFFLISGDRILPTI